MKYYSNNFKKHFNKLYIDTSITGYRYKREQHNIISIGVNIHNGNPITDDDVKDIRDYIQGIIMWDKWFRSDRARVDNVLWLLDAMDDDCQDFSDYEADIVNE